MRALRLEPVQAEAYVERLNRLLAARFGAGACPVVQFEVSGVAFDLQTVLHIPQDALGAVMEAAYALRDEGAVCVPALAPLDLHDVI